MTEMQLRAELENGLAVATGCTEPVALAYAGAVARSYARGEIKDIQLEASANIIKNAFVVGIPGTSLTGLKYAVAIGAVCGGAEKKLALLENLDPAAVGRAKTLVDEGHVDMERAVTPYKLFIRVGLQTELDSVTVEVVGTHTNVARVVKNGEVVHNGGCNEEEGQEDGGGLTCTLEEIFLFCTEAPMENFPVIREAIRLNGDIATEGLSEPFGLRVGKTIQDAVARGLMGDDVMNHAMMRTGAASDARMAGADLPVMSNSGSGNQGITATVPVLSVWERLDGKDEDRLVRACALSNFVTIHIKRKFGVLSALCGAVVAGAGASCGIVYLMGGGLPQIENAIQNTLGNVAGMLCDGAKASCALKISTCTNAAMQSALLAMDNLRIKSNEGIVEEFSEHTIDNFAELGNKGSEELDRLVLNMIINKPAPTEAK